MNRDNLRQLIAEAQHSCFLFYNLIAEEKTDNVSKAVIAPLMKWGDVVDALINEDENLAVQDLQTIILEPMKLLTDACAARLQLLGKKLNTESTAVLKLQETAKGDVFAQKKAYVQYANELLCTLEAVTGNKYPRIKER